jgi:ATP-dependent Clp protease ATP-binding subunit ClpA
MVPQAAIEEFRPMEKNAPPPAHGRDEVLRGIARAFVAGLDRWARTSEPVGVFLFAGPTGVGKTVVALAQVKILGNRRESLVRIDCFPTQSLEFQEKLFSFFWAD